MWHAVTLFLFAHEKIEDEHSSGNPVLPSPPRGTAERTGGVALCLGDIMAGLGTNPQGRGDLWRRRIVKKSKKTKVIARYSKP